MFNSQFGQDKFLEEHFFKGFKNGVFFDIGAHDGISLSNSYFFEKESNWSGICIEPNPNVFSSLEKNRTCTCLPICISNTTNTVEFTTISGEAEMLSGITAQYDNQHVKRIDQEIEAFGGSKKTIEVQAQPFNQVVKDQSIHEIHYLSIDTEGGEYEILESINFSNCLIHTITVENNYKSKQFRKLLKNKGFQLIKSFCCDELYINTSSPFYPGKIKTFFSYQLKSWLPFSA